ncbi:hypothetical protein [Methanolobus halotolerans]|uniref:Uncharacterized protein n=1 Tax=Methanolobus halotolerans TaxID=2052935 RepID=A0A4E0QYJ8_9EURY|nr:hypothetical protein [Methanolobus halotolerans]TGC08729.1 hypothetical protein CUN85_08650 [Methanolobus halotolerans]
MKTERKIIVSENGKLVLKKILLSGKDGNGKHFYLFDQDKKKEKKESYYEHAENNFLLIGLLQRIDMSRLNKEEITQLMYRKHEKEERFLKAGEKRGFNLGVDMDPDEILRFYISLTPEERVSLNCKP